MVNLAIRSLGILNIITPRCKSSINRHYCDRNEGMIHDLFSKEITAGLQPANLDLRLLEITFGCLFKFNVPSVIGIVLAAFLFKTISK